MNTQRFRNVLALPALITVGLLANQAPAPAQPLQHPVGSWLYTVTISVDDDPAHNIVFQGLETYIMDGGYIETDQLSFSPTLGHAYALLGNRAEAQKVLDRLLDPKALSYVAPYNVAIMYAGLGNTDQTFAWLDRAYQQRSYYLPVYLTTDARLDGLHGDPR